MAIPQFPKDVSPALKEHIKASERLMLKAYFDPAGVPTIGWGHIRTVTAADARRGRTITEAEARALFEADLDEAEMAVRAHTRVNLNQNQYDALTDFVFNLGSGAYQRSTLLKKLNAGDYAAVPAEFMRWNKAKDPRTGKLRVLNGLTTRRSYEATLFAKPAQHPNPPINYGGWHSEATVSPVPAPENTSLWGLIVMFFLKLIGGSRAAA